MYSILIIIRIEVWFVWFLFVVVCFFLFVAPTYISMFVIIVGPVTRDSLNYAAVSWSGTLTHTQKSHFIFNYTIFNKHQS